ncbi:MAG: hypothetical protein KDI27_13220 [Gammaproteobacteria bacterium]|nr:hypothetical protein [Gammaproteobacteria bacterium]MCP5418016.1 hypothetical protein [Chromatiaceae bacterium]
MRDGGGHFDGVCVTAELGPLILSAFEASLLVPLTRARVAGRGVEDLETNILSVDVECDTHRGGWGVASGSAGWLGLFAQHGISFLIPGRFVITE